VIGHSLGNGYYYEFADNDKPTGEADLEALRSRMQDLVARDVPIDRDVISYQEALDYFAEEGLRDTLALLEHRNESKVAVYRCEGFQDLAHGPLAPSTGALSVFELVRHAPGFALRYPPAGRPKQLGEFSPSPLLFDIYQEYKEWGRALEVASAGALNRLAGTRGIRDFIWVAESLHNKKISVIADQIKERRATLRAVLVAGPSSSGKTTFTKKLAIQLRAVGLEPAVLALDDYFLPREITPRDENGEYDFESIRAIDIELLNDHILELFEGKEIGIPEFDFRTGQRRTNARTLQLSPRGVLLMEGIHGLNDELTPRVPPDGVFRIYVSALTQLNLDDHNRISTTDNRLLRRLVRDYQFRGHSALATFQMWPSVRRGENKNIFPYQDSADAAFNSALDYELGVLRGFADPLLRHVKPVDRHYSEALRLLSFLDNFAPIDASLVPDQSILREFVGRSAFKY
jgi:uridine kinase